MVWRISILTCMLGLLIGCESSGSAEFKPPPDARRPALKTEAELAAERDQRIRSGEVVPAETPTVEPERKRLERAAPEEPPELPAGSIQSEMLLVNRTALTVPELLYPLREKIAEAKKTHSGAGLEKQIERLVRTGIQQEVGAMLVYEKAVAELDEQRLKHLEALAKDQEKQVATREFGGSSARMIKHFGRYGLTVTQFREMLKRQMVVRGYTRDILMPQVVVRREELFEYYKTNREQFSTAGTRELLLIEAPFQEFLPEGASWRSAAPEERTRAKLAAVRHIRAARTALDGGRAFDDVAREFSKGPNREDGGSLGQIGKPLKAPLEELSQQVFTFSQGQYTEAVELESGWFIAGCGRIQPAQDLSFAQAQEKIREELTELRFNRLSMEYVIKLFQKSTVTAYDGFVRAAIQKAASAAWPVPDGAPSRD